MVASDGNEAISQFSQEPADLIITDLFMPNKNGQAVIVEIMKKFPGTKIFAITGKDTFMGIETELEIAKSLGAIRGFAKPIKLSHLLGAIKEL
jgi:YesN/AraC family two-component response regulator